MKISKCCQSGIAIDDELCSHCIKCGDFCEVIETEKEGEMSDKQIYDLIDHINKRIDVIEETLAIMSIRIDMRE